MDGIRGRSEARGKQILVRVLPCATMHPEVHPAMHQLHLFAAQCEPCWTRSFRLRRHCRVWKRQRVVFACILQSSPSVSCPCALLLDLHGGVSGVFNVKELGEEAGEDLAEEALEHGGWERGGGVRLREVWGRGGAVEKKICALDLRRQVDKPSFCLSDLDAQHAKRSTRAAQKSSPEASLKAHTSQTNIPTFKKPS